MASTKLSADDKKAIVELYQEVGQTAATVAKQYGVSVSTISRLLKSELLAEAYEALVRQKRGGGETKSKKRTSRKKTVSKLKKEAAAPKEEDVLQATVEDVESSAEAVIDVADEPAPRGRRRRTRSSADKKRPVSRRKAKEPQEVMSEEETPEVVELPVVEAVVESEEPTAERSKPIKRGRPKLKRSAAEASESEEVTEVVADSDGEEEAVEAKPRRRTRRRSRVRAVEEEPNVVDVTPEAEAVEGDNGQPEISDGLVLEALNDELETDDEGFDDAFDDDLDDEDEGQPDNITSLRRRTTAEELVQIQPLSEANLSRMLYLVIDRTADLITMPMVFFRDLGQLPEEEEEKKTLPVFENHRVARRFSQRNQRVIKVPDGQLISKTAPWLEAKGITRCLLDGQVYSLESSDDD